MRALGSITLLFVTSLFATAAGIDAQAVDSSTSGCLQQLEQETPRGTRMEVTATDGTVVVGRFSDVNSSTSSLLLRPTIRGGRLEPIPLGQIKQVTFRKSTTASRSMAGMGFVAGAIAGVLVGNSLSDIQFNGGDGGEIGLVIGGLLGGTLGWASGSLIGNSMMVKVNLECW